MSGNCNQTIQKHIKYRHALSCHRKPRRRHEVDILGGANSRRGLARSGDPCLETGFDGSETLYVGNALASKCTVPTLGGWTMLFENDRITFLLPNFLAPYILYVHSRHSFIHKNINVSVCFIFVVWHGSQGVIRHQVRIYAGYLE